MNNPRFSRRAGAIAVASLVLFALAVPRASGAATIRVPVDYPTIQQAIDASAHGDTVLVAAGSYFETIDFGGKNIAVTSEQGPKATTIDAMGTGSVVIFRSGEGRSAVISGFTIRGGVDSYSGAGIDIAFSSPTIRGNVITDNRGCTGVGVHSYFSSPRIENNTITRNSIQGCTGGWGIGIYVGGDSAAEIVGNVISDNSGAAASGGGIALFAAGSAVVTGNLIAHNSTDGNAGCGWGGGIAIANFVQATIVNNIVVSNRACYGGAIHWRGSTGQTVLVNNTIAHNDAASWPGIYATGVDSRNRLYNNIIHAPYGPGLFCENAASVAPPVLNSNDVYNMQGPAYGGTCADQTGVDGNISVDPSFVAPAAGDYRIAGSAPVVNAGNNSAPFIPVTDFAGNPRIASTAGSPDRIDIGAYEYINRAPTADAGLDQTLKLDAACLATVTLVGRGVDPEGDALTYTWGGAAGTFTGATLTRSLPAGSYRFILTVTDGNGGAATDSVLVTVRDTTPPSISALTATPNVLPVANHELVAVSVSASAADTCGGNVACRIVSVTSNEPVTGLPGGDIGPDWQVTGDMTVALRAERSNKGTGRIYTITVECTDGSGNAKRSTVTVTVPRK